MLLKQLDYFIKVVEYRSFTKAAAAAYISQSAISQQIQALENSLGVQLLERHNRSFSLTSAGEYLYRHAPDLLESAAQLEAATTIVGQRQISHLTVGYLREYAGIDIARAVSTFNQHFPKIQINLRQGNHEELYDLLNDEKVDLIFSDQRRALSDEYINRKLVTTNLMILFSSHHPLASKKSVGRADLTDQACILVAPESQQKEEANYYRQTLGIKSDFVFAQTLEGAYTMVAANLGYMITDQLGVVSSRNLNLPMIKSLPLHGAGGTLVHRDYYLFWQEERTTPATEEFAKTLEREIAKLED
ncbi:LysR family transcriptional regulator [Limosilactobacillus fermentum]|uniref:LysR family transcriptional regulator n=1 Tax=Limosilactobacillus fermentum TaxID=1613 RepID=UPI002F268F04